MNRVVRWTNVPLDAVFLVFSLPRKRMEDIKVTPKLGLLAFFLVSFVASTCVGARLRQILNFLTSVCGRLQAHTVESPLIACVHTFWSS